MEIQLVWLMGHVSHLVTDATIHPIVQAIVGSYEEHKDEHRICEMTQDSLIYFDIKKMEIRYSEFSSILKFCQESPHIDTLVEFWAEQTVKASAEDRGSRPGVVAGDILRCNRRRGGRIQHWSLFRHIGTIREYTYNTREEIISMYPNRLRQFYQEIKLPTGATGSFRESGFNRAVTNVIAAWNALYTALTANIAIASIVRDCNLDTGVDMDSRGGVVPYWMV